MRTIGLSIGPSAARLWTPPSDPDLHSASGFSHLDGQLTTYDTYLINACQTAGPSHGGSPSVSYGRMRTIPVPTT